MEILTVTPVLLLLSATPVPSTRVLFPLSATRVPCPRVLVLVAATALLLAASAVLLLATPVLLLLGLTTVVLWSRSFRRYLDVFPDVCRRRTYLIW